MAELVIREYEQQFLAGQAADLLKQADIPMMISSDDVGGAYPQIMLTGGYRIIIPEEYEQQAEEILGVLGDYSPPEHKGLFS
jgi:hypothetical protein